MEISSRAPLSRDRLTENKESLLAAGVRSRSILRAPEVLGSRGKSIQEQNG